jgi:hypothetical protein
MATYGPRLRSVFVPTRDRETGRLRLCRLYAFHFETRAPEDLLDSLLGLFRPKPPPLLRLFVGPLSGVCTNRDRGEMVW